MAVWRTPALAVQAAPLPLRAAPLGVQVLRAAVPAAPLELVAQREPAQRVLVEAPALQGWGEPAA